MKKSRSTIGFLKKLRQYDNSTIINIFELTESLSENSKTSVEGVTISNLAFAFASLRNLDFKDCTFELCDFQHTTFSYCSFRNCQFENCPFPWVTIAGCDFLNCEFNLCGLAISNIHECAFDTVFFRDCWEMRGLRFEGNQFRKVVLDMCKISFCHFDLQFSKEQELFASGSSVSGCEFYQLTSEHAIFSECELNHCVFSNCELHSGTFRGCTTASNEFSSIDLQTISKSNLHLSILKKIFGVHEPSVKKTIQRAISNFELLSVFVSFSFEDIEFAKRLDNAMNANGVKTFLWPNDAPGGQRMKQIMADNIKECDKSLFIASKSSLRSVACQFELSESRKKYEKTWEEVLFPIHIDNYLFELEKYRIPLRYRDEFWDNVCELREISSKDFSRFAKDGFSGSDFDTAVEYLVKDLRNDKSNK